MKRYNEIHVALDFADKYGATSVRIELDEGIVSVVPSEAIEIFDGLDTGESFTLLSIGFEIDDEEVS